MKLDLPEKFSATKDNVLLQMKIDQHDNNDSHLKIQILYCETEQLFRVNLNSKDILSHKQIGPYYQFPQELFEELYYNFNQISLLEKGFINFNIAVGRKKLSARLQVYPVKNEKQKIQELLEMTNGLQKRNVKNKEGKTKILVRQGQQFQGLQNLLESMSQQLKEQKQERNDLNKKIRKLRINLNLQQPSQVEQEDQQFFIEQLIPHPEHKYNSQFEADDRLLTKINTTKAYHNFIHQQLINPRQVWNLNLQVGDDFKNISLGIVGRQSFNQYNTLHDFNTVTCQLRSERVWVEGQKMDKSETFIGDQEYLQHSEFSSYRIQVDRKQGYIYWHRRQDQGQWQLRSMVGFGELSGQDDFFFAITMKKQGTQGLLLIDYQSQDEQNNTDEEDKQTK